MTVELLDSMGDDLTIVNAARVSYAKESQWAYWCLTHRRPYPQFAEAVPFDISECNAERRLKEADAGLIRYLMGNHHGTPFEMVMFQFRVRVPIGVAREWQRHRIGSFNEVSTRYVEMQPEFYTPGWEAIRAQVGKPGHYEMVAVSTDTACRVQTRMHAAYEEAYGAYQELLELGVAKELARNVLPLGLMTEFYWGVNLRSLFNFVSLRSAPTALLEIRVESQAVEDLVRGVVPVAYAAFVEHGRRAP